MVNLIYLSEMQNVHLHFNERMHMCIEHAPRKEAKQELWVLCPMLGLVKDKSQICLSGGCDVSVAQSVSAFGC